MELKWQACRAASDQSSCEVTCGHWAAAGSPDHGRRGMNRGAAPTGGLLLEQGSLSRQGGGGGIRVAYHPPRHKPPEGS